MSNLVCFYTFKKVNFISQGQVITIQLNTLLLFFKYSKNKKQKKNDNCLNY